MEAVLLANAASTLFMVGVAWFVGTVHYPLFAAVGARDFASYHEMHSRRTTWVVLPAMSIELSTSIALVVDPPAGASGLAVVGAILAVSTWALTALAAVPAHEALGAQFTPAGLQRLRRVNLIRTLVWTAHGVVVVSLLSVAL